MIERDLVCHPATFVRANAVKMLLVVAQFNPSMIVGERIISSLETFATDTDMFVYF